MSPWLAKGAPGMRTGWLSSKASPQKGLNHQRSKVSLHQAVSRTEFQLGDFRLQGTQLMGNKGVRDHWPTTTEEASADRPHPSPARPTFAQGAPSSFLSFGPPASVGGDVTRKEIVEQKLNKELRKQTT